MLTVRPAASITVSKRATPLKKSSPLVSGTAAALAAVIMATSAPPAFAQADLALGATVFNNNCAACHTGGGNSVRAEATLQKVDIEKYLETPDGNGLKLEAILYQVRNGKGGMPAWEGRLDDDEIDAVAAYVFDQASGNKW